MSFLEILALLVGVPYAALVGILAYLTIRDLLDRAGTTKSPARQASAGDASENEAARTLLRHQNRRGSHSAAVNPRSLSEVEPAHEGGGADSFEDAWAAARKFVGWDRR